ncbi:MAG TPA: hypothetical protein PLO51_02660, partial [Candidatus Micrarchaeota archaeon]|nr:hypothetical protein [Candidatus Micrarchaeota archaeon]
MQVGLSAQKQAAPENADATLHSGLEWISSGRALDDFILIASVIGFLMFAYSFILYPTQIFPDNWFPSSLAAWGFKIIFSAWVLTEIVNSAWSRKNSIYFFDERKSLAKSADFAKAKSQDKGSYWVVVCATWIAVFATFLFRGMGIGT